MIKKEMSTHCVKCGKSFEEVEKKRKRALCIPCYKIAAYEYNKQNKKLVEVPIYTKYEKFKVENRKAENRALSKRLMGMSDRDEWKKAISERLDQIIADKPLWEFICRDMENYKKRIKKQPIIKQTKLEDYEQL